MASPSRRRTRAHRAWKVPASTSSPGSPTRPMIRSRSSAAARLVNVTARIRRGATALTPTRYAIRWARTRVLPEPAPARIRSGPSVVVTARACSGLRFGDDLVGAGGSAGRERGGDGLRVQRGRRAQLRLRGRVTKPVRFLGERGLPGPLLAGSGVRSRVHARPEVQPRALDVGLRGTGTTTLRGLAGRGGTHPTILGWAGHPGLIGRPGLIRGSAAVGRRLVDPDRAVPSERAIISPGSVTWSSGTAPANGPTPITRPAPAATRSGSRHHCRALPGTLRPTLPRTGDLRREALDERAGNGP